MRTLLSALHCLVFSCILIIWSIWKFHCPSKPGREIIFSYVLELILKVNTSLAGICLLLFSTAGAGEL